MTRAIRPRASRSAPPPAAKTPPLRLRGVPFPLLLAGLTAVYFMAGKLGLALAFFHASASPVWPPTGIAIASALLFGRRIWPAILVGAFLVNITTQGGVATSIGIAVGNTLEAFVTAWLIERFAGGVATFQRPSTIVRFALLAMVGTTISASVGVVTLWAGGLADPSTIPTIWLTWWLGDAVGALVVTPFILLWARPVEDWLPPRSWIEAAFLAASIIAVGWTVFVHQIPTAYVCLPPLVWAALRFGRRGAVTGAIVLSGIALWGTLSGRGPFTMPSPNESLLFVQAFLGVITLTALVLAASVRERERVEAEVRRARDELEIRVQERTESLHEAVGQLEKSRSGLSEAQELAHIGSWEWDFDTGRVTWSDELYRIYGFEPRSIELDYQGFLDRVHPEDRDRVHATVTASFESGEPFEFEHRIVRPDGTARLLLARGRVIVEDGRPVAMIGTGQDFTEVDAAEKALRESEERFRILAESASDVISRSGPEGTTYISPSIRAVLGYEPEEFLGRTRMDLVHPDDMAMLEATRRRIDDTREPIWLTFRIRHKRGHYVWVESAARPVQAGKGVPPGMVTVTRDVTERVERARLRELLHKVAAAANQARSADEALRAAVKEICEFRGWPLGHVFVPAGDGTGQLVSTGIWHPEEPTGHARFREVSDAMRFPPGLGLPGRVLSTGKPAWIPDVTADDNFPRAKLVTELGLAAAFGLPARAGDEVLAVLEFFTTEVLAPEPLFLEALTEVGSQLGQVLRRQQVEETLRRREAQLAQAQAIAHVGSWDWDVTTDRVTRSDEMYRIFGFEPQALGVRGDDFRERIHPDDLAALDRALEQARSVGGPFDYAYRVTLPDGSTRVAHTYGRVVLDADGRPVRIHGVTQDVTEQVAAEQALRESEQRYRFLADYSTDLITVYDPHGVCVFASPAARSLLGYAPGELLGRQAGDFIHPDDWDAVAETRRAILKSFATQSVICRLRRKTGDWIWAETTSRGVRDPATGRVDSIVAVTRNVTPRVQAERSVRLLQRVAAAANVATSPGTAAKAALAAVCEHTGWPLGHAYIALATREDMATPTDIWHILSPERFDSFRAIARAAPLTMGGGGEGMELVLEGPRWIPDLSRDPDFQPKQEAAALGLRSAFAVPVRRGDETYAILEFFSTDTSPPDADLTNLMENVADQLGEVMRRQQVEAALQASEVKFRAVAETANDAVLTIDDESRIVYCNAAVTRVFGHDADELIGRSLEELMPERFRALHRQGVRRFLETGVSRLLDKTIELVALHRDGHEIPIELSLSAWATGNHVYFTGMVRDITERKRAEQILTEKMEELSRTNAELALFSYVASHDLREPLRTVASNVQLIQRRLGKDLDATTEKSIRFALDGAHRMQELIDDLLEYSRVGTEGKAFERVDADAVVDEVLRDLRATIETEGAKITRDPLPTVHADRSQFARLVQNLVSNALKFHPPEQAPRIHVSAETNGSGWTFSVRDEGIGFDPQYAEHIFTIFQRLHTSDEFPGTGIGLAICRRIVERHGGRIWAESQPGEGSVFRFTVPGDGD